MKIDELTRLGFELGYFTYDPFSRTHLWISNGLSETVGRMVLNDQVTIYVNVKSGEVKITNTTITTAFTLMKESNIVGLEKLISLLKPQLKTERLNDPT